MFTLDTDVLIYHLKGEVAVSNMLKDITGRGGPIYISSLTITELFGFKDLTERDLAQAEDVLSGLITVSTDARIARAAGLLRSLSRMKTVDAIIATTALFTGSTLVTRNVRDFRMVPGLALLKI